jgi:hypothetical protein
MRRSLATMAVAAAVIMASGCGGGGDDDEAGGGSSTTTTREAVDVSTPAAVVAALADAGITCDNLVEEGSEDLALLDIDGTQSSCMLGGDQFSIVIVATDDDLSNMHELFTDLVDAGATRDDGQPFDKFTWVEVDHTVVNFAHPTPTEATRLAPIQEALGGRIESVTAAPPA